jgi:hypothetical protein
MSENGEKTSLARKCETETCQKLDSHEVQGSEQTNSKKIEKMAKLIKDRANSPEHMLSTKTDKMPPRISQSIFGGVTNKAFADIVCHRTKNAPSESRRWVTIFRNFHQATGES